MMRTKARSKDRAFVVLRLNFLKAKALSALDGSLGGATAAK
jgi:hypothetical protein